MSGDLISRKKAQETLISELKVLNTWFNNNKNLKPIYENRSAIETNFSNLAQAISKIETTNNDLNGEKAKTEGLKNDVKNAADALKEVEDKITEKQGEISLLNKQIENLKPKEKQEKLQSLNNKKSDLNALQTSYEELTDKKTKVATLSKTIEDKQKSLTGLKKAKETAEEELKEATKNHQKLNSELLIMNQSLDEKIKALRHELIENHTETCPLCGQKIEKILVEDDFKQILSPAQKQEEEAKETKEKKEKAFREASDSCTAAETEIEVLNKQRDQANEEIVNADKKIIASAKKLNLDIEKELKTEIDSQLNGVNDSIETLNKTISKVNEIQKEVNKKLSEKSDFEEKRKKTAEQNLKIAQDKLTANTNNIQNYGGQITIYETSKKDSEEFLSKKLSALIPKWKEDSGASEKQVNSKVEEYEQKTSTKGTCEVDLERINTLIGNLDSIKTYISGLGYSLEKEPQERLFDCEDILTEWTNLKADIQSTETTIEESNKTIKDNKTILDNYYETASTDEEQFSKIALMEEAAINSARNYVQTIGTKLETNTTLAEAADKNIEQVLKNLKEFEIQNRDELPDTLTLNNTKMELDEKQREINQELGEIKEKLKNNETNKGKLEQSQKAYETAQKEFGKWEILNKYFGGDRFRTIVQTEIMRPLINAANVYLKTITKRYELICDDSNEQLSIFVNDLEQAGVRRTADSLSGGERFMVSLALALSLSAINSYKSNIDILFIDEGFGTLDEDCLDSVMTTLENLQKIPGQDGRRVGIISHRSELAQRIPVQIKVQSHGDRRSRIEITNCGNDDL